MTVCSWGLRDTTGTSFWLFLSSLKGKFGPWGGLRDIIREVTALIMRACSQNDRLILYGAGFFSGAGVFQISSKEKLWKTTENNGNEVLAIFRKITENHWNLRTDFFLAEGQPRGGGAWVPRHSFSKFGPKCRTPGGGGHRTPEIFWDLLYGSGKLLGLGGSK